ncbi:MAG: hypothetical protein IJP48_06480 [Synergistaceae bacterium]|nr:hypothetical protein [Synergistaceae bacterium]
MALFGFIITIIAALFSLVFDLITAYPLYMLEFIKGHVFVLAMMTGGLACFMLIAGSFKAWKYREGSRMLISISALLYMFRLFILDVDLA